ncbi:MAG: alpha-L-fucosidase [Candidatus Hydrogenedentota bacterium]
MLRILCAATLIPPLAGMAVAENKPEREQWFMDQGLGLFIHWGVDSTLGSVISHSLAGASEAYANRYFEELPQHFNPVDFDPARWARLAKLAGFRYVVFTAKHHSGFCMWDTDTTDFNVMNTPHGKDIVRPVLDAFRAEGIAVGLYFSPEDFRVLHEQGHPISRRRSEAQPSNNEALRERNRAQLRELLTNYGKIDVLFLDAFDTEDAREFAWSIAPDLVITRGAMETPEQKLPDAPIPGPWEACFTMGTQWQFKPTNEDYKSGAKMIEMLIETRAKGGNLLLNIGPTPDGTIPFEQDRLLRELALWMFVNGEAVYDIEPCPVIREDNLWFTKAKASDTVYVHVTGLDWPWGEHKEFTLEHVRATDASTIQVLGHGGEVLEYRPGANPAPSIDVTDDGVALSAVRAQRLYNDRKWPNPVVLKITDAAVVE